METYLVKITVSKNELERQGTTLKQELAWMQFVTVNEVTPIKS